MWFFLFCRFRYPNTQKVIFETIVAAQNPNGVAFDSVNKHLYYTEYDYDGTIMRCDSDGSNATTISSERYPYLLTLDIQNRLVLF